MDALLLAGFRSDSRRCTAARAETGVLDRTERLRATEPAADPAAAAPDGVDARGGRRDGDGDVGVDAPSRAGGFLGVAVDMACGAGACRSCSADS